MFKIIDKEEILSVTMLYSIYELREFLNKCCNYRGNELDGKKLQEIKQLLPNMKVNELKKELLIFNFQVL